jgi:hypothetical protein
MAELDHRFSTRLRRPSLVCRKRMIEMSQPHGDECDDNVGSVSVEVLASMS